MDFFKILLFSFLLIRPSWSNPLSKSEANDFTSSSPLGNGGMGGGLKIEPEAFDLLPPIGALKGFPGPPPIEAPKNIDESWYLDNGEMPRVFREALKQDKNAREKYIYLAHQNCTEARDHGLLKFFEENIDPLLRTKPRICEGFSKNQIQNQVTTFVPDDKGDWVSKYELISYDQYTFNTDSLNEEGLSESEKYLRKKLIEQNGPIAPSVHIPLPSEEQSVQLPELIKNQTIDFPRERFLRPDAVLVKTMLLRLWDSLSLLEKMEALNQCPTRLGLNEQTSFWKTNNSSDKDNPEAMKDFIKICQAEDMKDIVPYIDDSIMAEFSLYAGNSPLIAHSLVSLCLSWPSADVVTPKALPSTSIDKVIYHGADIISSNNSDYSTRIEAFNLLNQKGASKLSEKERQALSDYTGNGFYDAINAYEMWGSLGVYMLERNMQKKYDEQMAPKREYFNNDKDYEEAMIKYIVEGKRIDLMTTNSGTSISQSSQNLKDALGNLDHFDGVTFGGHQLSGHLLKGLRIREGATFSPGFFMSTSTRAETARGFLGIWRADPKYSNTQTDERRKPTEEVTGYYFVVKNRTGAPVANYSQFSGENEVIIHPDARFKILKVETLSLDGVEYPNAQVIYMEELE